MVWSGTFSSFFFSYGSIIKSCDSSFQLRTKNMVDISVIFNYDQNYSFVSHDLWSQVSSCSVHWRQMWDIVHAMGGFTWTLFPHSKWIHSRLVFQVTCLDVVCLHSSHISWNRQVTHLVRDSLSSLYVWGPRSVTFSVLSSCIKSLSSQCGKAGKSSVMK